MAHLDHIITDLKSKTIRDVCVCNGPTDRRSLNMGMCSSTEAKGDCQEQDTEGRR